MSLHAIDTISIRKYKVTLMDLWSMGYWVPGDNYGDGLIIVA